VIVFCINCYIEDMKWWFKLWVCGELNMWWMIKYMYIEMCIVLWAMNCAIIQIMRCCVHWVVNCGLYNHTTIRPFKGDELMLRPFKGDELMLRSLKGDELKIFENNWGVVCFVQFIDRVCVLKYFLGWTWIRRERPWWTLWSVGLGGHLVWVLL